MEFDLEHPLASFEEEEEEITTNSSNVDDSGSTLLLLLPPLFSLETEHMLPESYIQSLQDSNFNISMRRETISIILKLCSGHSDPLMSYLSVNYLDRFFAAQGVPRAKPWVVRLVAITCVTLAAKMMKAELSVANFQCGEGFIFDGQTIERMEMVILGALKWRMRSITPFSFLNFFIAMFKFKDPPRTQALKSRAVEIIFKAQKDIKLLELSPSVMAASALLSGCHELFPMQFPCFLKAVSACPYVNKEKLASCFKGVMQGIIVMEEWYDDESLSALEPGEPARSSETPANVLDRQWSGSSSCCCCSEGVEDYDVTKERERAKEKEKEENSSSSSSSNTNKTKMRKVRTRNSDGVESENEAEAEAEEEREAEAEADEEAAKRQRNIGGFLNSFQLSQKQQNHQTVT